MMRRASASEDFPLARGEGEPLELVGELFRTAARNLHVRIADRYDVDVPVRIASAEFSHFGEVLHRLGREQGSAYVSFLLTPSNLPGLITIEGPLLYRLTGRLLGEDNATEVPPYRSRPPSEVDMRIARRVAADTLDCVQEAAPPEVSPRFQLHHAGTGARPPVRLPHTASVVEVSLDFGAPEAPYGLMTLIVPVRMASMLWPVSVVEPGREQLGTPGISRAMPVNVTVVAELARVKMSLAALRQLTVGQVLDLGPSKDVSVRVGDRVALVGEPGEVGTTSCVRVTGRSVT